MIGARVVKTCLAVAIAIFFARSMQLSAPHFAGIVAVLSVQPSLYRSLRHGLQHIVSAVMGALLGAVTMYLFGNSFIVMGLVTLLIMTMHVKLKWTNSILVSVVILVNTMGSTSQFFGESALNQMSMVMIGTLAGTLVNLLHKPVHQERADDLLIRSEGMLRALLYYLYLDLAQQKVMPYPEMRKQIEEVRKYIERGKEICVLIQEDKKFHGVPLQNISVVFQSMESMVERIRDVSKELQKIDPCHHEISFCQRAIVLTIRVQEKKLQKKQTHTRLLANVLNKHQHEMLKDQRISIGSQLPFLNIYNHLIDYLRLIENLNNFMQELWEMPSLALKKFTEHQILNEFKVKDNLAFHTIKQNEES